LNISLPLRFHECDSVHEKSSISYLIQIFRISGVYRTMLINPSSSESPLLYVLLLHAIMCAFMILSYIFQRNFQKDNQNSFMK